MVNIMIRVEGLDPAYPVPTTAGLPNGEVIYGSNGITIRDHFAFAALPSIIVRFNSWEPKNFTEKAYEIADAMLEERAKV